MSTAVALRPRSFSELFDAAFQLTREHFAPLAVLSALLALPGLVFNVVNLVIFGDPSTFVARGGAPDGYYVALIVFGVLTGCWFFVALGGMVSAASDAYLGARVDAGESLRRAVAHAGPLVGGNVLAYLRAMWPAVVVAVAVGVLMPGGARSARGPSPLVGLLIPVLLGALVWGLITLLRYSVVSAVVVLEERGATDAARRARELARGSLKRIFGLAVIFFAVATVLGMTVLLLSTAVLSNPIAAGVVSGLMWIPIYPVVACVLTVLYYDLRIRRDGFDVEYAALQLGGAAGSAAAAH